MKILRDPQDNMCRGYGFITFKNAEDAQKALEDLNNTEFEGQKINIEISKRSNPRPKTPGIYRGRSKDGRDRGRRSGFDSRPSRYDDRRGDRRDDRYRRERFDDRYRRSDRRDDRYRRERFDDRRRHDDRDDRRRRDSREGDRYRAKNRDDDRDYRRKRSVDWKAKN